VKKAVEDDEDEAFWEDEDNVAKTGEGAQIIDDDLEEQEAANKKVVPKKDVNPWLAKEKASTMAEEQAAPVQKITHRKPDGSIDYDYPRVHDKPKVDYIDMDMLGNSEQQKPVHKHPGFSHPEQFKTALAACFRQSPEGDCTDSYFGHISEWDTSKVTNMAGAFMYKRQFNQDLSNWDVSQVTNMKHMFYEAQTFDQDLSRWNTKNVKDMTGMFYAALKFNQNIGKWDVGQVTDMSYMFKHAQSFNFDLSLWKGPAAEAAAHEIFEDAQSFLESFSCPGMSVDGPVSACNWFKAGIEDCLKEAPVDGQCHEYAKTSRRGTMPNWDTSQIRNMENLFKDRKDFNADITKWDTSNVITMNNMFEGATSFNQPIGAWDTSKVTDMSNMFQRASRFNKDIINWDVSHVTTMRSMFAHAEDFNQPLERWDVRKVKDMFYMFTGAKSFQQPIHTWKGLAADAVQNGEWGRIFDGAWAFNNRYTCRDREGIINVGPISTCVPKELAPKPPLAIPTLGLPQEKKSWISTVLPALGKHKSSSVDVPMDVSDHSKKFTPKNGVVNNKASEQSVKPLITESSDGAEAEKERQAILRKIERLNKKPSSKKHGKIIVHHDDGDYDEYEHVPEEEKKGIFAKLIGGGWNPFSSSSDDTAASSYSEESDDYEDVLAAREGTKFDKKYGSRKSSKKVSAAEDDDDDTDEAAMGATDEEKPKSRKEQLEAFDTSSYKMLGAVCLTICALAILMETAQKYGPKFNHGITFDPKAPFFREASNAKGAFSAQESGGFGIETKSSYGASDAVSTTGHLSPQNRDVEGGLVKEAPASKKFSVRSLLSK
jgi:surface protein